MKSALRHHLPVLLFYTVLTLIMTWPLITQLGTHYAGNNEDLWVFQWDNWWTRYALQHGYDILFTPMQFYPVGVSLAAHSLSFYNSFIWIPLAALCGDIAAYNLTVLLTFILSGYTMFLLAEYLVNQGSGSREQLTRSPISDPRSFIPALIAGLVYAFAPYHFSQSLGHVSLASAQWFPLLALFILKAARETQRRNSVWIGLTTLLITATRLQFLVLGGVVLALFVLVDWLALRRDWTRGAWVRLIAGAALGLILSLPIVLPAAQLFTQAASPDDLIADEQTWGQTDLAAYFVPMTYHPVFGPLVQPVYENFVKNRAWMPFLGYSVIALSIWGAVRAKRRAWPWAALGLFCFIMALGPFLRVNGAIYEGVALPYALIGDRFPLNILRSPDRYNLLLPLALGPLAALGVAGLLNRTGRARIIGTALGLLILFEYLGVPYPASDPLSASPFYAALAADPEPYAILDIPLQRTDTKYYLYYQTLHEHPIAQGRVARVPAEATVLFEQIPLLNAWSEDIGAPRPPDLGAQLARLAAHNIRYIVLHKNLTPPRVIASLRNYFARVPAFEDDQLTVYSTLPVTEPITLIGDHIGVINTWVSQPDSSGALKVRVRWSTTAPLQPDYAYQLTLTDDAGSIVLAQTAPLTPTTSTWPAGTIVLGEYQLDPAAPLPPGRYQLHLSVRDADRIVGTLDLSHRILNAPTGSATPWLMVATEEPRARLDQAPAEGDFIELRAADVSRRGNVLALWTHWRLPASAGLNQRYRAQILDMTGNVAIQAEEIYGPPADLNPGPDADLGISKLIELPLWNLPPGNYRLAVGLIDPDTGERLPVVDANGHPLPDNRYVFAQTVTMTANELTQ